MNTKAPTTHSSWYSAHVEVDLRKAPDPDTVLDTLEHFHAAVGMSEHGWFAAQLSLQADSLLTATIAATSVVEKATGASVVALEIMTEAEFNARGGWETPAETVLVPEAAQLLGTSPQAVLQRINAGTLPAEKVGRQWEMPRSAVLAEAQRKAAAVATTFRRAGKQ